MNIVFAGILLFLIGLCVYADRLQAGSSIKGMLTRLDQGVSDGDWARAMAVSRLIDGEWGRSRIWIALEDSHDMVLEFERTWAQCKVYLKERDRVMVTALIGDLRQLWKQMEG